MLIISSLNYVNLTLANLSTRLKEIGMRKTIGAYNQHVNSAYFEAENEENFFHASMLAVDDAFAETFDFTMNRGRFFQKDKQTDDKSIIINQAAVDVYKGNGELIQNQLVMNDET